MRKQELWKGLVAGSAAGLAGAIAMTQFQNVWSKAAEEVKANGGSKSSDGSGQETEEDATMKVAGKGAELAGYTLSHEEKKKQLHLCTTDLGLPWELSMERLPSWVRVKCAAIRC
jgi:hypothetical protein